MTFEIIITKEKTFRNGEFRYLEELYVCLSIFMFMNNYEKLFQKILFLEVYSIISMNLYSIYNIIMLI